MINVLRLAQDKTLVRHAHHKFSPALPAAAAQALLKRGGGVYLVGRVGHLDDALLNGREVELVAQHPDFGDQQLVDIAKVDNGLVGHNGVVGRIATEQQMLNLVVRVAHGQEGHVHKVLGAFAGVDDGVHLHGGYVGNGGQTHAVFLDRGLQPREGMVDDVDLHALDEADERLLFDDGGHEAVLVYQQILHTEAVERLDAEEVQVVALAVADLEAEGGASHQTGGGQQRLGLQAFQQPKRARLNCACL